MRPEFADFVRLIYPEGYYDYKSLINQAKLVGFNTNIFFFDHNHPEKNYDNDSIKQNEFEADFACKLAEYACKQGN